MNEGNVLVIENDGIVFDMEDDIQDGITITLKIKNAYITMTGLYTTEELKPFLEQDTSDFHVKINSCLESRLIGKKKVRETIFSTKPTEEGQVFHYKIIFITDDTTVMFTMEEEEWNEVTSYIQFIANGYQHLQK